MGRAIAAVIGLIILAGCGGGSSTPTPTPTPTPVANTVTVTVSSGPANNAVNFAYVSVQVCNPGSTTSCATIPNVQVDTGSSGLRILASAPGVSSLTLTPVTGAGVPVNECTQFADGSYLWGPVVQADVTMAGETAASLPIQIVDSGTAAPLGVPSTCIAGGGNNLGTSTALQANGILGIGTNIQDCGSACASTTSVPAIYWLCPTGGCSTASVPLATQVSNPVSFFNSDNNGVILAMNPVAAAGATTASGTLTFGIGTQTDNALSSSAKVFALSGNSVGGQLYYTILATYNSGTYPAFVDTAQPYNGFLDPTTVAAAPAGAGITNCPLHNGLYCTSSAVSLPFTAKDSGTDSATVTLSIGDATTLYNSSVLGGGSNAAFGNLVGEAITGVSDYVDLGMPFFYGKTVYVGIAGKVAPTGVNAPLGYWAF